MSEKTIKADHVVDSYRELMSNLVYRRHDSGGVPADLSLINPINKFHAGNDIGKMAEAA